ncbi:hypothetical protein [Sphingopyxis macrogoltabida]|nr:hypothetical protein [Sphingopyxis macrogoltabida]
MTELDVWLEAFGLPVGRIVSADADDLSFSEFPIWEFVIDSRFGN